MYYIQFNGFSLLQYKEFESANQLVTIFIFAITANAF